MHPPAAGAAALAVSSSALVAALWCGVWLARSACCSRCPGAGWHCCCQCSDTAFSRGVEKPAESSSAAALAGCSAAPGVAAVSSSAAALAAAAPVHPKELPKPPACPPSIELMMRADSARSATTGVDTLAGASSAGPPSWGLLARAKSAAASTRLTAGGLTAAPPGLPSLLPGLRPAPLRLPSMPAMADLDRQGCGECCLRWRKEAMLSMDVPTLAAGTVPARRSRLACRSRSRAAAACNRVVAMRTMRYAAATLGSTQCCGKILPPVSLQAQLPDSPPWAATARPAGLP